MDKGNVNNSTMENTNQSYSSVLSSSSPLEPSTNIQNDTTTAETVSFTTLPIHQPEESLNSPQNQPSTSEKPIEKENEPYVPEELSTEQLEEKYGKRHEGRIVKWVPNKGYGFIQTAASQYDYFFHATDILPRTRDQMNQDEKVTFSITRDKSESQAKDRAVGVVGDGSGQQVPIPPNEYFHGRWSSYTNRKRSSQSNAGGNRKSWSQNNRNSFQGNNQRRSSNRSNEAKNKISSESWRAKKKTGGTRTRKDSKTGEASNHFRSSQTDSNFSNEQYAQNQLIYAVISPQQQALWQAFCASSPGVPPASFVSTPPPNAQVMSPQDSAMLQMNWNNAMAMYPQQAMMNAYAGYQGYNHPMGSLESIEGMNLTNSFQDLSMYNSRSSITSVPNVPENINTIQPMVQNSSNDTGVMQAGNFNQQQQPTNSYNMQQQYTMNPAVQEVTNMQQYTIDPSMYYNYAQPNMRLSAENQMMNMNNMYLQNPSMDPRNSFTYSQSMEGIHQLNTNETTHVEPGSGMNNTNSAGDC